MTSPSVATVPDVRLVPSALTSWAVTAAGIVWGASAAVVVAVAAVLVAALISWRWRMTWPTVLAVAAVGVAFAAAVGLRVDDAAHHPIATRYGGTAAVVVTPSESPRVLRGMRMMFRANLVSVDGHPTTGRVVVFASGVDYQDVSAGRPAAFRAGVSRPTRRDLSVAVLTATGTPRWGSASLLQRAAADVRARFAEAARSVLPGDQAAMLPALVLGDTSALGEDVVDEFRAAGLTHLTAVSGANVTIVCGTVLVTAGLVGPRIAVALAAIALIAFVVVVQPSASVLRAAVMGSIALFAVLSKRRRQAIPALSACVLVLLVAAPQLAVDVGFALSVSATAALVIVAPRWARRLTDRGWPQPLAAAVSVAAAAHLVTAPLVAGMSGTFSMVSILANLVVAAVISPITVIGTAAAVLTVPWPAAAELMIRFTGPALWWLTHVASWAAAIPGAVVTTPSGWPGVVTVAAAGVAVVALWGRTWGRVTVVGAAVCLVAWTVGAA
ncbi:ComEC/Rec2 family competence protein [Mycolicibacterium sp. P1-18]|uniref:ComEC/Rec2 family competence protein n=1 Tax=Mycolicibacterium sp. P1-18 TaxID=2024615 RepID=UPI0011F1632B|nr:ComEC/Rec2 family competence protein [Mycolicibacterium sp. P1-18]KAA0094635.1 ComEC/Rec2 family competence protein [Mycolicibacterium sp. P1-18]